MAWIVYESESTKIAIEKRWGAESHKTLTAAKRARTRMINKGKYPAGSLLIADSLAYKLVEKMVPVKNMMSGKTVMESVNTPNYLSVSSEAYWSA